MAEIITILSQLLHMLVLVCGIGIAITVLYIVFVSIVVTTKKLKD